MSESNGGQGSVTASIKSQAQKEVSSLLGRRALIFIGIFVVLVILFQLQSNGIFFTPRNLSLLLRQGAILAVVASGVAVLMIMAEIDLSVGSAVFLCGVLAAELATTGEIPLALVVAGTVGLGIALGAMQGAWVVFLGIPSFIATLAGLLAFRGIGLLWTDASTIGPLPEGFIGLSESFIPTNISFAVLGSLVIVAVVIILFQQRSMAKARMIGELEPSPTGRVILLTVARILLVVLPVGLLAWIVGGFQGIPMALVWVAVVVAALSILMGKMTFGRNAYLVGANREAAIYSGINIKRVVFTGFIIMGALYGVAGVLLSARIGASTPGAGQFLELDAIAAAVIGGVSLRGGVGTVVGAVMGAFLLTLINNGMSILNVSSFTQLIIKAAILVAALALDAYILRRSAR